MCAASPGCRVVRPGQSYIVCDGLDNDKTVQALTALLSILSTSYGPTGRLKTIHNNSGGHATLTSCASRMIPALSVSNPILKLIIPVVEKHIGLHCDGGLFCGLLSLKIILSSMKLGVHRHLITEILDIVAKDCIRYLTDKDCPCVVNIDITSIKDLVCLAKSMINSKPGCCLTDEALDHVQNIMLEVFFKTANPDEASKIQYLCVEGLDPCESHIIGGILFETPQIPTYLANPLVIKTIDCGPNEGMVKVALFNISLAGDTAEFVDVDYEIEHDVNPDQMIVDQMKSCTEALIQAGVGLVACQRVVHPEVKKQLRNHGVLVLDRLGSRYIYAMQYITGCTIQGTFMKVPEDSSYGWLDTVKHVVMYSRSYLHLDRSDCSHVTVVLGHRAEEALEELKAVCVKTQHVLQTVMRNPRALMGGGCWQTLLAHYIRSQVHVLSEKWSMTLECTPLQVKAVANSIASDLEYVAMKLGVTGDDQMTDLTSHHHWTIPSTGGSTRQATCCCGNLTGYQNELNLVCLGREAGMAGPTDFKSTECYQSKCLLVMDPYDAFVNGFRTALASACMVLGVHNIIQCEN